MLVFWDLTAPPKTVPLWTGGNPGVSNDLFRLVHEAFLRDDRLESFYSAIDRWKRSVPSVKRCYRFLADMGAWGGSAAKDFADASGKESQVRIKYLRRWSRLEKNGPNGREHIYEVILDALKALRRKVGQDSLEDEWPPK